MLLRHLGKMSSAMHARFIKAGEALEGQTADEQLEVASQLTLAILETAWHRGLKGSQENRAACNTVCAALESFTREIGVLRFGRVQRGRAALTIRGGCEAGPWKYYDRRTLGRDRLHSR